MSQPSESRRHLSSFHLEAIRLGVASSEERAWAAHHGATCARCAALAAHLADYREEFVANLPRPPRAPASERRPSRWRSWIAGLVLAPLAVTGALLLVGRTSPPPTDDGVLVKGSPVLGIVARRGERIFPLRSGDRVRPGDQVRFVIKRMSYPYGLVASVDGAGRPNIYVPYEGKESARVVPADEVEMAGSIVLDDRLGPERFFALYSKKPLPADAVRRVLQALGERGQAAVRATTALEVGADAQSTVLLEKVAE